MAPTETDVRHPGRPSRRGLARGAAWAVPTLAVGVAAPAVAASAECTPAPAQDAAPAFTSAFTGWTKGTASNYATGSNPVTPVTDPIRYSSSTGAGNTTAIANTYFVVADPVANQAASVALTTTTSTCIAAGTYEITYPTSFHGGNTRTMTLTGAVLDDTDAVRGSNLLTVGGSSANGNSTRTFTVTVARRTRIRFRLTWAMPTAAGGPGTGNDIYVGRPTITRTGP